MGREIAAQQLVLRDISAGGAVAQGLNQARVFRKFAPIRVEQRHLMRQDIGDDAVARLADDGVRGTELWRYTP